MGFALSIYNYKLLPDGLINVAAILLPWLEVIVGGSLLLGIGTAGGALIATALFSIFAGALTINLIRGLDIACGCFSTAAQWGFHQRFLSPQRSQPSADEPSGPVL